MLGICRMCGRAAGKLLVIGVALIRGRRGTIGEPSSIRDALRLRRVALSRAGDNSVNAMNIIYIKYCVPQFSVLRATVDLAFNI